MDYLVIKLTKGNLGLIAERSQVVSQMEPNWWLIGQEGWGNNGRSNQLYRLYWLLHFTYRYTNMLIN